MKLIFNTLISSMILIFIFEYQNSNAQNYGDYILTPDTLYISAVQRDTLRPTIENLLPTKLNVMDLHIDPVSGQFIIVNNNFSLEKAGDAGCKEEILIVYTPTIFSSREYVLTFSTSSETNPIGWTTLVIKALTSVNNNFTITTEPLISPNPATDFIDINIVNKGLKPFAEIEYVQIFDMLGIEVLNVGTGLDLSKQRIDVSHLATGVYYIKIGDKVEKFVKM